MWLGWYFTHAILWVVTNTNPKMIDITVQILTKKTRKLIWWGLLADRYGLPIRGYWQTVMVCQLEIIGRPCTIYLNGLSIISYWQTPDALHKRATITALYKRWWQCACACLMLFPAAPCIYLSKPKSKKGQKHYPDPNSAQRISPSHTPTPPPSFMSYHKAFRVECCEVHACLPHQEEVDLIG